jgi:hypothetical protein
MGEEVQELVSRFLVSYQASQGEPNAEESGQISNEARRRIASDSPEPACVAWWLALPPALQQKWLADPETPTMREAWRESVKRLEGVNFARASVSLSGFKTSAEQEAMSIRYINGEVTISEVIQSIHEHAQRFEMSDRRAMVLDAETVLRPR